MLYISQASLGLQVTAHTDSKRQVPKAEPMMTDKWLSVCLGHSSRSPMFKKRSVEAISC